MMRMTAPPQPMRERSFSVSRLGTLPFAVLGLLLLSACGERDLPFSPSSPENVRSFSSQTTPAEGMNLPKIYEGGAPVFDPPPGFPPYVPGTIVVLVPS